MRPFSSLLVVIALAACPSSGPAPADAAREAALDAMRDAVASPEWRRDSRVADLPPPDKPRPQPHWQTLAGPAPAVRYHTATLLEDGRVLIAGGEQQTASGPTAVTAECWIFDPDLGFAKTASLGTARRLHAATRLDDGRVLVTGGSPGAFKAPLASAEIYDPKSGTWSAAPNLPQARASHTAVRLLDGRVLVVGGISGSDSLATLAIFNPVGGAWIAPAAKLQKDRSWHTSTLLASGKVLIVGGVASSATAATYLDSAESFDPTTGTIMVIGAKLSQPRAQHTASLLPGGQVLLVGGGCSDPGMNPCTLANDESFDPVSDTFSGLSHFGEVPHRHAAASLPDGRVVVTGGSDKSATRVVVFSPKTLSWSELPPLGAGRRNHTATTLGDGSVLVVGGEGSVGGPTVEPAERLHDP